MLGRRGADLRRLRSSPEAWSSRSEAGACCGRGEDWGETQDSGGLPCGGRDTRPPTCPDELRKKKVDRRLERNS